MKTLTKKNSLLKILIFIFIFFSLFFLFNKNPLAIDLKITSFIQNFESPSFDNIMKFVSFWGNVAPLLIVTLLTAVFFYYFSYKKEAFFILLVLVADFINLVVKYLVNRPRPTDLFVNIYHQFKSPSFPSSHVFHYVVFFGLLIYFSHVLKFKKSIKYLTVIPCYLLILFIPISRIYLGVHWVTDVIGAFLLGLIALLLLIASYNTKKIKFSLKNIDKIFNLS
jgi:membrane-associated phospholipid phosphatase